MIEFEYDPDEEPNIKNFILGLPNATEDDILVKIPAGIHYWDTTSSFASQTYVKPSIRSNSSSVSTSNNGTNSNNISLTRPSNCNVGDLLLAQIVVTGGLSAEIIPPEGWTQVPGCDNSTSGNEIRQIVFYKFASLNEVKSYVFEFDTIRQACGQIVSINSVSPNDPFYATLGQSNSSNVDILVNNIDVDKFGGIHIMFLSVPSSVSNYQNITGYSNLGTTSNGSSISIHAKHKSNLNDNTGNITVNIGVSALSIAQSIIVEPNIKTTGGKTNNKDEFTSTGIGNYWIIIESEDINNPATIVGRLTMTGENQSDHHINFMSPIIAIRQPETPTQEPNKESNNIMFRNLKFVNITFELGRAVSDRNKSTKLDNIVFKNVKANKVFDEFIKARWVSNLLIYECDFDTTHANSGFGLDESNSNSPIIVYDDRADAHFVNLVICENVTFIGNLGVNPGADVFQVGRTLASHPSWQRNINKKKIIYQDNLTLIDLKSLYKPSEIGYNDSTRYINGRNIDIDNDRFTRWGENIIVDLKTFIGPIIVRNNVGIGSQQTINGEPQIGATGTPGSGIVTQDGFQNGHFYNNTIIDCSNGIQISMSSSELQTFGVGDLIVERNYVKRNKYYNRTMIGNNDPDVNISGYAIIMGVNTNTATTGHKKLKVLGNVFQGATKVARFDNGNLNLPHTFAYNIFRYGKMYCSANLSQYGTPIVKGNNLFIDLPDSSYNSNEGLPTNWRDNSDRIITRSDFDAKIKNVLILSSHETENRKIQAIRSFLKSIGLTSEWKNIYESYRSSGSNSYKWRNDIMENYYCCIIYNDNPDEFDFDTTILLPHPAFGIIFMGYITQNMLDEFSDKEYIIYNDSTGWETVQDFTWIVPTDFAIKIPNIDSDFYYLSDGSYQYVFPEDINTQMSGNGYLYKINGSTAFPKVKDGVYVNGRVIKYYNSDVYYKKRCNSETVRIVVDNEINNELVVAYRYGKTCFIPSIVDDDYILNDKMMLIWALYNTIEWFDGSDFSVKNKAINDFVNKNNSVNGILSVVNKDWIGELN